MLPGKSGDAADKLYPKIVSLLLHPRQRREDLRQLLSAKKVTCATSASLAYQLAGILASGDVVGHRDAVGGSDANILRKKSTVAKAMTGVANLPQDKVDVVWVGKKYADLPAKYRQKGVLYVQDSNVCICAGGGAIYSCNGAKGSPAGQQGALQGQQDHQWICVQLAHPGGGRAQGEGGSQRDKTAFYGCQSASTR